MQQRMPKPKRQKYQDGDCRRNPGYRHPDLSTRQVKQLRRGFIAWRSRLVNNGEYDDGQ